MQPGEQKLRLEWPVRVPRGGGNLGGFLEVADPRPRACARVRPRPATSQGPAARRRPSRRPAPALHRPHLLRRACQDSTSRLRPHGNRGAGVLLPLALGLVSIRASLLSSGLPLAPSGASSRIYQVLASPVPGGPAARACPSWRASLRGVSARSPAQGRSSSRPNRLRPHLLSHGASSCRGSDSGPESGTPGSRPSCARESLGDLEGAPFPLWASVCLSVK